MFFICLVFYITMSRNVCYVAPVALRRGGLMLYVLPSSITVILKWGDILTIVDNITFDLLKAMLQRIIMFKT